MRLRTSLGNSLLQAKILHGRAGTRARETVTRNGGFSIARSSFARITPQTSSRGARMTTLRRLEDPLQLFERRSSFGDQAQSVLLQCGHLVFLHLAADGSGIGLAGDHLLHAVAHLQQFEHSGPAEISHRTAILALLGAAL